MSLSCCGFASWHLGVLRASGFVCVCAEHVCVAVYVGGVLHFLCAEGLTRAALSAALWVGLCCSWVWSHLASTLGVAEKRVVGVSVAGHGPVLASGATS